MRVVALELHLFARSVPQASMLLSEVRLAQLVRMACGLLLALARALPVPLVDTRCRVQQRLCRAPSVQQAHLLGLDTVRLQLARHVPLGRRRHPVDCALHVLLASTQRRGPRHARDALQENRPLQAQRRRLALVSAAHLANTTMLRVACARPVQLANTH